MLKKRDKYIGKIVEKNISISKGDKCQKGREKLWEKCHELRKKKLQ